MRYDDLKAKKATLVQEVGAIFTKAEKEGRDLTAQEKERDDAIHAELATINADLARIERQRETERNASGDGVAAITGKGAGKEDPTGGFKSLGDFALSVREAYTPGGARDERLNAFRAAPTNFQQEQGGASQEGYNVPAEFRARFFELALDEAPILNDVDLEPTNSNSVHLDSDEDTPWATGGVVANWRAEGTQMSATRFSTQGVEVMLHELYVFTLATEELLSDAPRLGTRLMNKSASKLAWKILDSVMNGNGVGKPMGWMQSPALVSVAIESGQVAAVSPILYQNLGKMLARVLNMGQAQWYMNPDLLPGLMGLTIGNQPVWTPPNAGLKDAPNGFLLGRPIRFTEAAKGLGTKGDIQLINPKGYYAIQKAAGVEFAESVHLYFDYNLRAFRWTFRFNGRPYLSAPVAPPNSANTKSHFVTLDAR